MVDALRTGASPPKESASSGSETAGGTHDTGTHEAAPKPDGAAGSRVSGSRMNPNAPSWEPGTAAQEAAPKPDGAAGSRVTGSRMNPNAPSWKPITYEYLLKLLEGLYRAAPEEKAEALCKVAKAAVFLLTRGSVSDRTKAARVLLGLLGFRARFPAVIPAMVAALRHGPPSKGILVARMIVYLADQACCRYRPERLLRPLQTLARKGGPEAVAAASMAVERLALAAVCSGAADLDWEVDIEGNSDDSDAHSTDTNASQVQREIEEELWEASVARSSCHALSCQRTIPPLGRSRTV